MIKSAIIKNMHPLLVFDLDGTLIDSAPDIVIAVNRTLLKYGKIPLADEVIVAHIGEGLKKLISDLFLEDRLNAKTASEIETEFLAIYEEEMLKKTRIFPGVEEFLSNYPGPIAIITNKNIKPTKVILEHLGLQRFPWVDVYGADSLSERKPSPLPLQTMMRKANSSAAHTIMIGDGLPDMVSAHRAGVASIAIQFGYTDLGLLLEHKPFAVLEKYSDLASLVDKFTVSKRELTP